MARLVPLDDAPVQGSGRRLVPLDDAAPAPIAAPAQERSTLDWLLGRNLPPEQQAQTDAWQQSLSAKPTGPSGAENMVQGMTFNYGDDVARLVGATGLADRLNTNQEAFRQQHPVGSMVYEGLGSAIGAAGAGKVLSAAMPSVAAAMSPVGRSIGQRALRYGAAGGLGSGLAASGEQDATLGGVAASTALGTGLGAATPYVGRMAQGVFNKVTGAKPAIPQIAGGMEDMLQQARDASEEFGTKAAQKYADLRNAGVVLKDDAARKLRDNMLFVAGKTNRDLAGKTAGMKKRVMEMLPQRASVDFENVHELSMEINRALRKGVDENDARLLGRMKDQIDNFIANAQPDDLVRGGPDSVKLLKEADALYAQKKKLELLSAVIDNADTGTGQYTQSQMANTIRREAKKLYDQVMKKKVRGFSAEEIKLLRDMKKGTDVGAFTRWLAKFAPRGAVSSMAGGGIGSGIGGAIGTLVAGPGAGTAIGGMVGGAAMPAAGYVAGNIADKTAVRSLGRLASSAAYGPAALGNIPTQLSAPLERLLLPAGVGASTAIGQRVQ